MLFQQDRDVILGIKRKGKRKLKNKKKQTPQLPFTKIWKLPEGPTIMERFSNVLCVPSADAEGDTLMAVYQWAKGPNKLGGGGVYGNKGTTDLTLADTGDQYKVTSVWATPHLNNERGTPSVRSSFRESA